MFIFGLFRSAKFVTFMFTFLDSLIIVAITFDVITAIIGVDLFCFYGIFVAFSTNIDKDSTGVLQPLAIALAGSSVFKVFILQYILPDFECSVVIDLT